MSQDIKQLKFNIWGSIIKQFFYRSRAFAEKFHQLGLRLRKHFFKLQNSKLRILLHISAIVGVHNHHLLMIPMDYYNSKRKQLIKDCFP